MCEKLLDFLTNLQQWVPQGFNVSSKGTLFFQGSRGNRTCVLGPKTFENEGTTSF